MFFTFLEGAVLFTKGEYICYPTNSSLVNMTMHALVFSLKERRKKGDSKMYKDLPKINQQRMAEWGRVHCPKSQDTTDLGATLLLIS